MSKFNKAKQISDDQKLIAGILKHLATSTLTIGGKAYLGTTLVSLLQPRIDAGQASIAARAASRNAVVADDGVLAETNALVVQLKQTLKLMFGNDAATLADFGSTPRKTPQPLTAAQKVARADKARATRKARGTLGSKQKKAITGAITAPATPASPAPGGSVNGAGTLPAKA
jgi:hypothetical protein